MIPRAKTLWIGGAAATVLAAGTLFGVAQAQPSGPPTSPTPGATRDRAAQRDSYIDALARNLGVTPDRLRTAMQQTATQQVDQALADGRITAEQAQRAKDRIAQGQGGFGFGGFGGGHGPRGGNGPQGERGMRGGPMGFDGLAGFLGITDEQLRTELKDKSLAQVAEAHGKTRDQLKQFIQTNMTNRLNEAVQSGRLTQEQADRMRQSMTTNIDQMIDRVWSGGPMGMGPGGREMGPGGRGMGPGGMGPGGMGPGGMGPGGAGPRGTATPGSSR